MTRTAAVIVTHDSGGVLPACLDSLGNQSRLPDRVCIVDSGSGDTAYLDSVDATLHPDIVRSRENIGFARANNLGWQQVRRDADCILFLNPDTILESAAVERAVACLESDPGAGVVTGLLEGYDFAMNSPTGRVDSAGIFRRWYGRWVDRGQGELLQGKYGRPEDVPAACGALMFCRGKALEEVSFRGGAVFDPDFFLYKEDIELCLRLRKAGWKIRYRPEVRAWHGRGWQKSRSNMPYRLRKMAARNEILLYRKHPSPYILWALFKYMLVAGFRI